MYIKNNLTISVNKNNTTDEIFKTNSLVFSLLTSIAQALKV